MRGGGGGIRVVYVSCSREVLCLSSVLLCGWRMRTGGVGAEENGGGTGEDVFVIEQLCAPSREFVRDGAGGYVSRRGSLFVIEQVCVPSREFVGEIREWSGS